MNLRGRRIHIVGSADPEEDAARLEYVHSLVSQLTETLAEEGATFVIPFGKQPFLKDRTDGPAIIFDWTVAEAVLRTLKDGRARPSGPNGRIIATLATTKTDSQIPTELRPIYDELRDNGAVDMEVLNAGWTAGAVRRSRLAQLGDILIGISGGQGLEQLAIEYSSFFWALLLRGATGLTLIKSCGQKPSSVLPILPENIPADSLGKVSGGIRLIC